MNGIVDENFYLVLIGCKDREGSASSGPSLADCFSNAHQELVEAAAAAAATAVAVAVAAAAVAAAATAAAAAVAATMATAAPISVPLQPVQHCWQSKKTEKVARNRIGKLLTVL